MPIIMRSCGTAKGDMTYAGQYLKEFDHEAHGGVGEAAMTRDPAEALQFADMEAAFTFYRASPTCRPWRADGKPNRPLTASTWEFITR